MSLLILVCIGLMSQTVVADSIVQRRVTLDVHNAKLISVLGELRKQSGCNFIYNERFIKGVDGVTVKLKNSTLENALKESLKNTKLTYKVQDGIIVIVPKKVSKAQKKPKTVKGVVKDDKGNPLPGVTVILKGTNAGVSTDIDGKFSIEVTSEVKTLIFSFIGMETQEVTIPKEEKEMVIVLKTKADELDEVVVTGYKQTTKREATGSVGVITKEAFENKAAPMVDQILQGRIAGVSAVQTSGRPGETSKIRIRGTNTITGNAEPLWVVDGVPLQKNIPKIDEGLIKSGDYSNIFNNGIAGINPSDIENVTVLKDASAAAIYGSRAAGGVIVVTTKRGKAGKMSVNYTTNYSVILKPQRDAGLMNSREKLDFEEELWNQFSAKRQADGLEFPVIGIVGEVRGGIGEFEGMTNEQQDAYLNSLGDNTTDWFNELFRNSVTSNHYLSLSGGENKYRYYISLGYSGNDGLVKNTDYTRYNINAKLDINPTDKLSLGLSFDVSKQQANSYAMKGDPFTYAYFANPYERPYNEDGSYRADATYNSLLKNNYHDATVYPDNGFNILREINETSSETNNTSYVVTADLKYNITEKFRFTGIASYSFTDDKSDVIIGKDTWTAFHDRLFFDSYTKRTYGSISQTSANNTSYTLRGQFNYSTYLDDNNRISLLAGTEIRGQKSESIYEKRYGYDPVTGNSSIPIPPPTYFEPEFNYGTIMSMGSMIDGLAGQSRSKETFASFYGSIDYFYRNKYALSLTVRTDGSNHFGNNQQFNPTWSLGAAWHIDEEDFMGSVDDVISSLSLKLATGYTGNVNRTIDPQLIMRYDASFRKTYEDAYRMGAINTAPNPNLRWEKTHDYKVAIDLGLFNERIRVSSEAYYRRSKDLVTNVPVQSTTGFTSQGYNTSEVENKGIELTLNTLNIKKKDFRWTSSINIANNLNKLVKYESPTGSISGNKIVGYPLNSIFGGKLLGIDPTTGYYNFKLRSDAEILKQSDLNAEDNYKYYLGTSNAPISGGFSTNFTYKSFSLGVSGNYSFGAKIMNKITPPQGYNSFERSGNRDIQVYYNDLYVYQFNTNRMNSNRWTELNPITTGRPRIVDNFNGKPQNIYLTNVTSSGIVDNGVLLEDISYVRIGSISLSYNVDNKVLKPYGISSLGFSLVLNNFFTFTDYSGIDPESSGAVYPVTRSVSFGINLGF